MDDRSKEELGELLSAYLDDEITPKQRAQIEELLESDAEARSLLSELERTASLVRALPDEKAPPSIADEITSQLERASLLGDADEEGAFSHRNGRSLRSILAFAAMIAIVAGGGLYVSWQLAQSDAPSTQFAGRVDSDGTDPALQAADSVRSRSQETMSPMTIGKDKTDRAARKLGPAADRSKGVEAEAVGKNLDRNLATDISPAEAKSREAEEPDPLLELFADLGMKQETDEADLYGFMPEDSAEPTADTVDARMAGAVSLDDTLDFDQGSPAVQTFEQSLVEGADLRVIQQHTFDNEPLRLTVSFADTNGQRAFDSETQDLLTANSIEPLRSRPRRAVDLLMGIETGETADIEQRPTPPPPSARVVLQGEAAVNYVPQSSSEVQYVIRTPPELVRQLVDLSFEQAGAQPELRIGQLAARRYDEAVQLADALDVTNRAARRANKADEPEGDLLSLMEQAGLAPLGGLGGGLAGSEHASAEQSRQRRVTDGNIPAAGKQPVPATKEGTPVQEDLVTLVLRLVTPSAGESKPASWTTNGPNEPSDQ